MPFSVRGAGSSTRDRLILAALLGAIGLMLLFASPAAAKERVLLGGTVTGQLPEKEAEPLAEVEVTVSFSSTEEVVATTATNGAGGYEVDVEPGVYDVRFDPHSEAFQPTTVRKVEVNGPHVLNLVLSPAETVDLSGVLRDAGGEPVAEARVTLSNQKTGSASTFTDGEGHFDVAVTPGEYTLTVFSERPTAWQLEADGLVLEANRELELRLPARHRLAFEVLGAGSVPIPGATVSIGGFETGTVPLAEGVEGRIQTGPENATTGEGGKAEFLVFGGPFGTNVQVRPPAGSGYGEARLSVPAVEEDTTFTVRPPQTVDLTGVLRDADGEPVKGARVTLRNEHTAGASSTTDAEGRFDVAVAPGEYVLTVFHEAAQLWNFEAEGLVLESSREIELRLPKRHRLLFEVLGTEGAPIPGTHVGIAGYGTTAELGEGIAGRLDTAEESATTGEDGRAEFLVFGGTPTVAKASVRPPAGSGYGEARPALPTVEEDTAVTVHPPASVALTGILRDSDGSPIKGARVTLFNPLTGSTSSTTGVEGQFDVAAPSGEYILTVFHEGPQLWNFESEGFLLESSREIKLRLPTRHHLTFEVLGAKGAPIPGARVDIAGYGTSTAELCEGIVGRLDTAEESATTGEGGRAEFLVFGGTPTVAKADVRPPEGSGYGEARPALPTIESDTTLTVNLAGGEGGEDTTPPILDEFGFEPSEIDVSSSRQEVAIFAHIVDEPSGLAEGKVSFRSPSGEVRNTVLLERVGGNAQSGLYKATVLFEQFSEVGSWGATVTLTDNAGNSRELGPEELQELGFPSLEHVFQEEEPEEGAPELAGLKISPDTIEAPFTVDLFARILAGPSGFEFGRVVFSRPNGEPALKTVEFHRVSGSPTDGTYEIPVAFPAGSEPGEWRIFEFAMGDGAGHERRLDGGQVQEMGFPNTVTVVGKPSTAVSLSSSPDPSVHGQRVTFTAKVEPSGSGPAPQGTVAFVEGSSTLGVANLTAKGTATFNTTALGAGAHEVVAAYSGDANHAPGESAPWTQKVEKASTQVSLSSSLNPAPFGASGTVKATVKAVAPGAGTPAGTVTFLEGETVLATVQMAGGAASLQLKSLAPGTHKVTAAYSGDQNDYGSEGGPFVQTIVKASTQLNLTSTLNPAPYGSSGTLKASIESVAPGGGVPTGTVTFREGETVLATVPLTGTVAKLALKGMEPGEHAITAVYNGSADYEASEDALTQTIVKATTRLTLTSTRNPAPLGAAGTIRATLATVTPGGGQASGTVTFREGETVLAIVPLSGTSATYPLKSLAAGTHEIVATYNGNADYEASSDAISQVISP